MCTEFIIIASLILLACAAALPSARALLAIARLWLSRTKKTPAEPPKPLAPKEAVMVAYHEAAHALVAAAFPKHKIPVLVEVGDSGDNPGKTVYDSEKMMQGRTMPVKSDLLAEICIDIAGRAAELLVLKEASVGGADDLRKAAEVARQMVQIFGMSQMFANRCFGDDEPIAEQTKFLLDWEAQAILVQCFARTTKILERNLPLLHEMAQTLCEKRKLEGEDLSAFCRRVISEENTPAPDPNAN